MKRLPLFLFFLYLLIGLIAVKADEKEDFSDLIYDPPPVGHIEPAEHAPFSAMEQELKFLVFKRGNPSVPNHFCIVGYQFENGRQEAIVLWRETHSLIAWRGHREPELAKEGFHYADSLFFSKALNLDTDLVDTWEDAGLSTFLTLRSQADAVIEDCNLHGKHYTIEPSTPPEDEN